MAGKHADRVFETSTTTGTGDLALGGNVLGYQKFEDVFPLNQLFSYCIEEVDGDGVPSGQWEVGVGYLSAGSTLVRDTVRDNSDSSAPTKISFAAGTKNVFNVFSALAARKSTHGFDLQYGMP